MHKLSIPVVAALALACVPAEGPQMDPGADCMQCHGLAAHYTWTAAGTVFPERRSADYQGMAHVYIELTDADGKFVTMESNPAGNFYTSENLRFPLTARARRGDLHYQMTIPVPATDASGRVASCNSCHNLSPTSGPGGRLIGPP